MSRGPALVLVDSAGNEVGVIDISGTKYLQAEVKRLVDALPSGTNIVGLVGVDPAQKGGLAEQATLATRASEATVATLSTEATLELNRLLLVSLDAKDFATQTTLATRASEVTLAAADTKLGTIDGVLDSIKDTDGIKKITDQLPSGTNEIGAVKQGTKATGTGAWPQALYDVAGNPVAVIIDNSIYRLETRSKLAGQVLGAGAEVDVTTIADVNIPAEHRLQTEARLAPGSIVSVGVTFPPNPAALYVEFLKSGGSENMLVNGSVTPVVFEWQPPATKAVAVQQMLVVFTADDFSFDGASFGPNAVLTNGIRFDLDIGGVVTEIFNIMQNEDYLRVPGRIPLVNNTGPKDVLGVAFNFGGLVVDQNADDKILITVRDNLTGVKLKYLTATIFGTEV